MGAQFGCPMSYHENILTIVTYLTISQNSNARHYNKNVQEYPYLSTINPPVWQYLANLEYIHYLHIFCRFAYYELSLLSRRSSNVLIGHALSEFEELTNQGQDCWLSRVDKMEAQNTEQYII